MNNYYKSVKFKDSRCFKNYWVGLDEIKKINVLIGRNNSGKSLFLDGIESLCMNDENTYSEYSYQLKGLISCIKPEFLTDHDQVIFNNFQSNYPLLKNLGTIDICHVIKNNHKIIEHNDENIENFFYRPGYGEYQKGQSELFMDLISKHLIIPFKSLLYRRILAERNIVSELADLNSELSLSGNGNGATNMFRRLLTSSDPQWDRNIVQKDLLSALNFIIGSETNIQEISVQYHDSADDNSIKDKWEIYLYEESKGGIPLSQSGSGLKTIILVLLFTIALPKLERKDTSEYLFAFEELENNLHPTVLRRLFAYLENLITPTGPYLFLTTHSSVALDYFSNNQNSQIIKIDHDGESARTTTISNYVDRVAVLSDLGVKASDILLTNCVVWVEGPSDRLYINHWIKMFSKGEIVEGRHYQCVSYGGALLANNQFKSPDQISEDEMKIFCNLLNVNHKFILVCDSDVTTKRRVLKTRVKRIQEEVIRFPGAILWITEPKEIEHYIPGEVFKSAFDLPNNVPAPEKLDLFFPKTKPDGSSYWEQKLKKPMAIDKVKIAQLCAQHMTLDNMKNRFDWHKQMQKIVDAINKWNK